MAIWTLRMAPGARWTLLAATGKGTRRTLYFFKSASVTVGGQRINGPSVIEVRADATLEIVNGDVEAEFLMLQGKPINQSVAQYGPFVMNTQAEIMQAMQDYHRTEFGGWPFCDGAPVHGEDAARSALHPGGRRETADQA